MEEPIYNPLGSPLAISAETVLKNATNALSELDVKQEKKLLFLQQMTNFISEHPNNVLVSSEDLLHAKIFGPLEIINITTLAVANILINEIRNKQSETVSDCTLWLELQSSVCARYIVRDDFVKLVSNVQYNKTFLN